MTELDYKEIDAVLESVFDVVMESGHTIDPKVREKLPDSSFGIIEEENGKVKRSYPLVVPGDKNLTDELVTKAVQFFHYCKPERRESLAKAIVSAIRENKISIEISEASQILRYVDKSTLPKTVKIVPRKPRSK